MPNILTWETPWGTYKELQGGTQSEAEKFRSENPLPTRSAMNEWVGNIDNMLPLALNPAEDGKFRIGPLTFRTEWHVCPSKLVVLKVKMTFNKNHELVGFLEGGVRTSENTPLNNVLTSVDTREVTEAKRVASEEFCLPRNSPFGQYGSLGPPKDSFDDEAYDRRWND